MKTSVVETYQIRLFDKYDRTHWIPKLPSYRKQSINLQSKSMDWFLCDGNFGV